MLVVGGGIIGCAVAFEAVRHGARVTVMDRAEPGREATWAAGGMLSPLGEQLRPDPFLMLGLEALRQYPSWVEEVEEASGDDVPLDLSGKLQVALADDQERCLRDRFETLRSAGYVVRWLDRQELRGHDGRLSGDALGGLLLDQEGQVDNRALGRAVATAAKRGGTEFLTGSAARGILRSGDRVEGVVTEAGRELPAGAVVLAAGAWSGRMEGLPRPLPVRPVRGQMVALDAGELAISPVMETSSAYLIPRRGGRLVVGSTVEERGFDRIPTAEGIAKLAASAAALFPDLADAPVVEAWAGLRPGTPDGLPILGPDPELDGLHYATGHYRNGILLAPVTGRYMAAVLQGRDDDALPPRSGDPAGNGLSMASYRPDRFD